MARKRNTNKDLPKVVVVGDAVATTGFSRVIEGIFNPIADEYDIHHIGVNYTGDPHDNPWKIYPAHLGGDLYGIQRLGSILERVKPDLVFLLNDLWIHAHYLPVLDEYRGKNPNCKVVIYTPIDAGPIDYKWVNQVNSADRFVVYTEFAKNVVNESVEFIRKVKEPKFTFPDIHVIPHGVDSGVFYPYEDMYDKNGNKIIDGKIRAKQEIYPEGDEFLNSFIVLNANRNQPRKRIDVTMKGFAMFAEDKPKNVKLYLHMGVEDMGWDITSLAERFRIDDRLIISSTTKSIPGVPDSRLNAIYNACDVGINTSIGEGWGLVSFEHAATRAAQIVPNHSACAEIWDGAAEFLRPSFYLTTERVLTEGMYVLPETVAESLQKLYEDEDYREELAERAYRVTQREEYSWESVAKRFHNLFEEVLNE